MIARVRLDPAGQIQQAKNAEKPPQFLQIVAKPKPTAAQVESSRARATREQPQRT